MAENGIERSQPEFSLGERLSRIEAVLDARSERFDSVSELFEEKIAGLRKELGAINNAQKEAVDKAEAATDRRLELIGAQIETDRVSANTRLQQLESAQSTGQGRALGATELKTSTLAIVGAIATVALTILYVVPLLK